MKPKKLVMSAFGSYGSVETIHFDSMDHGLFLIAGDTGAGKSTIFDAIMFALYDTMSGKERKGSMMRSEYAAEDIETYVEYTFSYGTAADSQTYTIKRYPPYERRSKRKNKQGEYSMIKQGGRVSLIMPDGREYPGRKADVDKKIKEIIGLTSEQFSKIAMIAQGEFQELIMDNTGKRKEIFQQIFSTEIYGQIEDKIFEHYKKSLAAVKENTTKLRETVEGVHLEAEEEKVKCEEVLSFLETEPERIQKFLEESISDTKVRMNAKQEELRKLEDQIVQTNKEYQETVSINQAIEEYEKEVENREKLLSQKSDIQHMEEECILAERAREVEQSKDAYDRCKKELGQAQNRKAEYEQSEKQLQKQVKEKLDIKNKISEDFSKKQPEILQKQNKISEELEELAELLKCQKKLKEEEKKFKLAKESLSKLEEQVEDLEKKKIELNEWLMNHENLEVLIEQTLQKEAQAKEQKDALEEFEKKCQALSEKEQLLHMQEKELLQANKFWEESRREYEEKNYAYIAAQSSFLAMGLSEGKPCPVCGSLEHPRPAGWTKDTVTKSMLDKAQKEERKRQNEKENCQLAMESQRVTVQKLIEELNHAESILFVKGLKEERQPNSIQSDKSSLVNQYLQYLADAYKSNQIVIAGLKEELASLREQQRKKAESKEEQRILSETIQRDQIEIQEKEQLLYQTEIQKKTLETQEGILKGKITIISEEEGKKELKQLSEQIQLLKSKVAQAEEDAIQYKKDYDILRGNQGENQKRLEELLQEEKETWKIFQKSLKEQGFAREETYQEALKLCSGQKERRYKIEEYQKQKVECETKIQSLEDRISGREKVSVEELKEQIYKQKALQQVCKEAVENLSYQYKVNARILERINLLLEGKKALSEEVKIMRSLNDAARGKVRFQTYIQRQYFKKIIRAANKRLARMTTNQFLLKCRELDGSGQGEAGLDLDVYNPVTGKSRDAHTLSGGETFLASLSMALGMADVVQNKVGKTHLDTMFIDEGFGSLSEEVRNTAVKVLLELAGDNRLVGVISHVSELKEQIPDKLLVTKGNHGSKAAWRKD